MWNSSSLFLFFNLFSINAQVFNRSYNVEVIQLSLDNNTKVLDDNVTELTVDKVNALVFDESTKQTKVNDLSGDADTLIYNTNELGYGEINNINKSNKIGDYRDYVPDAFLDTVQLIAKNGFPAESHTVKTEDGYLLTMHRIPHGKDFSDTSDRQAIFLQHGVLGSSSNFVTIGAEKGLAYILSEAGYDVWLGNFRGNTYCRAHVSLSTKDPDFWNFTWHESAVYDLPAMIDYINRFKKTQQLLYVGHSMGTTTLFALLSTRPEYNSKLKAAFLMAPVTYTTAIRSPIRYLAPWSNDLEWIIENFGGNEFLPQNFIIRWLGDKVCEINHYTAEVCLNVLFLLAGFDEKEFNKKSFPVILNHTPAGTSTRTVIHFAQEIRDGGKFQRFDYGAQNNMKVYGQDTPPQYRMNNITLPIALFCADNDWLAGLADMKKIYRQLKNPIEYYEVPMQDFNHLDFLWANDAPTLVYNKLVELLIPYKS